MNTPKYPRLIVSGERHNALTAEAKERKISLTALVEEKLAATDDKKGKKTKS